jgi:NlpE N-terminal domain
MGDFTPTVTTELPLLCRARICAWLAAAALVAGCGAGGGDDTRVQLTPMPEGLAGVYAGEFPCLNCEAIAATLWLRTDERFFLKQTYRGGAPGASGDAVEIGDTSAYAMGRWLWDEQAALIVLDSPGPPRRLSRLDEQRLQLQPSSKVEHLLTRDPAAPAFTDRVRIDGESAIVDGNGVFKECLSGLSLPIVKNSAFSELRRQHRTLNPSGKITRTAVEGRLILVNLKDVVTEMLIVDHVLKLLPGTGCEPEGTSGLQTSAL